MCTNGVPPNSGKCCSSTEVFSGGVCTLIATANTTVAAYVITTAANEI